MEARRRFRVPLTAAEAVEIQNRLRDRVVREGDVPAGTVGGADVSERAGIARAALVVTRNLVPVEEVAVETPVRFPYIPGLLSFREIPALLKAWEKLRARPDVLIVDGQGIAHPRRFGIASHLGVLLDQPSIGCAKSRLIGRYEEPPPERGAWTPLVDRGEVIGAAVRTRTGRRVVFVSIGHRVSLAAAIRVVLDCTPRYRLPEPQRLADRLSRSAQAAALGRRLRREPPRRGLA
ncbi:MAG TPA: deoxyribonuclease V [Planctomycetota bacterium]|nr:deoxyribonuclease V [Planctomycetota bacterium]